MRPRASQAPRAATVTAWSRRGWLALDRVADYVVAMRNGAGALLAAVLVLASGCGSDSSTDVAKAPLTIAVIGDTPYGDDQEADFPRLVQDVNRDADVGLVVHLGDIKTGGSSCDAGRLRRIRGLLDTFADPVVYTPGDNEWTDCHRPAAGGHLPTGRLALVRRVFFSEPGRTIGGRPMRVTTQARTAGFEPFAENVLWMTRGVVFATVHVVGSNNDRVPWFGARETAAQRATREAEFAARLAADLAWIDRAFQQAQRSGAACVVLAMQADMFAGGGGSGFEQIVARVGERARAYDGAVLLLNGDTHRYTADSPLLEAPNVSRIVVEGETSAEWLRLTIDPESPTAFSDQRKTVP